MPALRKAAVALFVLVLGLATPASAVGVRVRDQAPTFNGGVYAIAHRGPIVYLGGAFTSATYRGRIYPRLRLAALDARTGALLSWAPAADGTVRALQSAGDTIYAAGDFHAVGGQVRDSLAALSPGSGAVLSFRHTLTGTAYTLTSGNGRLYLGGSFSDVDGHRRAGLAAFTLADGELDAVWRPRADDTVHTLVSYGGRVFVGGSFHSIDEVHGTLRLAALHGRTGRVQEKFLPRPPAEVRSIAVDQAGVYVATAGLGGRAIAYSFNGAVRWQRVFDGDAATIATVGGLTYVGGHFDSACLTSRNGAHGVCVDGSQPRYKLAAVTATGGLASWAPKGNGVIGVRVLSVNQATGTLEAGGDFTTIDGQDRRRLAVF
ncbi:hypothetical protein GCM10010172_16860 [Paractinoplanes ferrugineus]|uniref:Pyrrolo-quinoline quinone repeat domain-containing protein n=1 Tax=Paractinoplanes ferrugineus TaxID=113564 RepID=A0A919IXG6_9ACTN|nr:PQQ-binding-like beta-propeller repeat protein [Actinoplanes ferrugineus]GIE10250.1 hypothetical protein Afe05nite_20900 [Actinoplanes ferrugineus]